MSDPKGTTSAYYAGSSYQQGSNSAVVAQDQAYAERLQQQEFGNSQQVRRVADNGSYSVGVGQCLAIGCADSGMFVYPVAKLCLAAKLYRLQADLVCETAR